MVQLFLNLDEKLPEDNQKQQKQKQYNQQKQKVNTIFKNEENNINEEIFRDYFLYQNSSYLTKVLYHIDEIKNDEIMKN